MGALAFFVLLFTALCTADLMVPTPFGVRPADCVLEVPHDAVITDVKGSDLLLVSHPSKGDYYHQVPSHCGYDMASIRQHMQSRRDRSTQVGINGWVDNAGWYPANGQNNLRSFKSTYTVPGNPPTSNGQTLFYFIGMQDNDDPKAVNIVQPVLTWGNGYSQWYLQSWACCPKNITVHSPPLFGLSAGSQVGASIVRISDSTWSIDSEFNGQHTTLNAQVGDYIYNWADVTLEVYGVNTCDQFAQGKAYFNGLVLQDQQGQSLQPKWSFTAPTACGGSIVQTSDTQIYIQHT